MEDGPLLPILPRTQGIACCAALGCHVLAQKQPLVPMRRRTRGFMAVVLQKAPLQASGRHRRSFIGHQ